MPDDFGIESNPDAVQLTSNNFGITPARRSDPKCDKVRDSIIKALKEVRRDHPWAGGKHQLAFHMTAMFGSIAAIFALWYGSYASLNVLPYAVVFFGVAFFTSILHEQEHDAIHANSGNFPFREGTTLNSLCMIVFWIFRPNGISGIARTVLHKHHHNYSGQPSDFEEQAITNGMPWGIKRLLCLMDSSFTYIFLRGPVLVPAGVAMGKLHPEMKPGQMKWLIKTMSLPFTVMHHSLFPVFLGLYYVLPFLNKQYPSLPVTNATIEQFALHFVSQQHINKVCAFVVNYMFLLGMPNMWRTFCLYTISSNCHYFEIDPGNVLDQTQVLDHWLFLPMNLFCWNFGKHHCLHHYVIAANFMERELLSWKGYVFDTLREQGVLFNDFGTFLRANRRPEGPPAKKK